VGITQKIRGFYLDTPTVHIGEILVVILTFIVDCFYIPGDKPETLVDKQVRPMSITIMSLKFF